MGLLAFHNSDDDLPLITTHASIAKAEISRYLALPYAKSPDFDVLAWWRANRHAFPLLAPIAQKAFGVKASATNCERMWTSTGLIATDLRHSLAGDNLNAILFINKNKQFTQKFSEAEPTEQ